ncbi:MAG: ABC transporter permease [Alphaproteobacteria bacterium]|nr:ABC transporter permease [Alphaproteobacteria bacterium]
MASIQSVGNLGTTSPPKAEWSGPRRWQGLEFAAPAILLFGAIFAVPIGYIVLFSFQSHGGYSLDGYRWLLTSTLFSRVLWTSIEIAVLATLVSVLLGYVLALYLSRLSARKRAIGLVLVLFPFWTSILVKSYSFTVILGRNGLINSVLGWILGGNPEIPLIFNGIGVLIGMSNHLLPFVVFPVLTNLLMQDRTLAKAAEIMGATPWTIFLRVTLPLSSPAILAGALMCMIIGFGFFVTPALLGGRTDIMLANLIDLYTRETLNWTVSSAVAVVLLVASGLLVFGLSRVSDQSKPLT